MMKAAQAKRLFLLVRAAKAYSYELPTGRDVAVLLYPGKHIGRAQIRAANAVVQRLRRYGCIRKRGSTRHIDEARLVTERLSAQFVLLFREMCLNDPELAVTREALETHARSVMSKGVDLDGLFNHALNGQYVTPVGGAPNLFRIGEHLNEQLKYLELFLGDTKK